MQQQRCMYLTSGELVCNRAESAKKHIKETFNESCPASEYALVPTGGTVYDTDTGYSRLYPGQYMVNGDFRFEYTCRGNLVLKNKIGVVYWNAGTSATYPAYLIMQTDGNLVAYRYANEQAKDDNLSAYWATNTGGRSDKPFRFSLLPEGAFVVVNKDNYIIWSTGWGATVSFFPAYGTDVSRSYSNKYIFLRDPREGKFFQTGRLGNERRILDYYRSATPTTFPGDGHVQVIDVGNGNVKLKCKEWITIIDNRGGKSTTDDNNFNIWRLYSTNGRIYINNVNYGTLGLDKGQYFLYALGGGVVGLDIYNSSNVNNYGAFFLDIVT